VEEDNSTAEVEEKRREQRSYSALLPKPPTILTGGKVRHQLFISSKSVVAALFSKGRA
jgi:hypothetical protein